MLRSFPILLSIDCQPLFNQHCPAPLHSHINKDNFHKSMLVKTSLKVRLKTNNDIDEAVNLFISNIQTSAWESAQPTQPHSHNLIIPLYIRSLIAQKRRARCPWQRSKFPPDKCHYNMLAQKLKRTLANYKNKSYTNHLESLATKERMVLSGRRPNNFFVYEIPQLSYATQMEIGYTLMPTYGNVLRFT